MAESKRIFNAGKMNRDLDDRLVPPGEYRDGLNIDIGKSEGSDVGAVENLKGNELIPGQDEIGGTTIGSVRDQSSNSIYWFTTSDTEDAIHEYGPFGVRTLIREPKAREAELPTCAPDLQTRITEPVGSNGGRSDAPDLPDAPTPVCGVAGYVESVTPGANQYHDQSQCQTLIVGVCGDDTFQEYDSRVGTPGFVRDDSLCVTPNSLGSDYTCSLANSGSHGIAVAQDGTVSNPNGLSFTFDSDNTADNRNANTGITAISHAITIVYNIPSNTPPYDNAADGTISCGETISQPGTDPVVQFEFNVNTVALIANTVTSGTATITGDVGTPTAVNVTSGIMPAEGYQWVNDVQPTPTLSVTGGGAHTLSLNPTTAGESTVLSGDVFAGGGAGISWAGATTEEVPPTFSFFEAVIEEPVALGSLRTNNIENSHGFGPMSHDYTGDWTITFTVSGSGWTQDFPNDPDFWLQISDSASATRLMSLSGSGPLTDTSMATGHYWECERNFGLSSRSGQLQLRAGDASGAILDTIDFTQDS